MLPGTAVCFLKSFGFGPVPEIHDGVWQIILPFTNWKALPQPSNHPFSYVVPGPRGGSWWLLAHRTGWSVLLGSRKNLVALSGPAGPSGPSPHRLWPASHSPGATLVLGPSPPLLCLTGCAACAGPSAASGLLTP